MAVLLVIAVTVGATLFFTRDGFGPDRITTTAAPTTTSDVASANDAGPVALITYEPTCSSWLGVRKLLASVESNGWEQRDPTSESSAWTPQVRAQHEAVGAAMRDAAEQVVPLAKQTPHRVMREMYEQFIAYGRAYAEAIRAYKPIDDRLARVNVSLENAIEAVCSAIDRGSVATRSTLVPSGSPPAAPSPVRITSDPEQFVLAPNRSCTEWVKASAAFENGTADWERLDGNIPATAWTPEQRGIAEEAARLFKSYASTMEGLGRQEEGTFEDFTTLAALYLRVYASATPTYTALDSYLFVPGFRLNNAINEACKAAGG